MKFWQKKNNLRFKTAVKFFFLIVLLSTAGFLGKNLASYRSGQKLKVPVSSRIPSVFPAKVTLEQELRSMGIEINDHFVETEVDLVATLSSGTTLFLKKEDNYSKTLASLQSILKNIRIEGKWPLKIDLRFRRPILSY